MEGLPVELLYEIHLFALSPHLPHTSRHLHRVFANADPLLKADYIVGCIYRDTPNAHVAQIYTAALRFPICDQRIFTLLQERYSQVQVAGTIELPKRLFRSLTPSSQVDPLLAFLRHLATHPALPPIDANSHDGYLLTRAVYARSPDLVSFLLDHRACPKKRNNLAVKVAIRQKDLDMLKLLLESRGKSTGPKRRKIKHRITPDATMLRLAVDSGAQDIVDFLYRELKVVPDLETLKKIVL